MAMTSAQAANAASIRAQYEQDLQLTLDAFQRDITNRLPRFADAIMKRVDDRVRKPLMVYFARVEAIRTSGRYSLDGERQELQLAAQAVRDQLSALRRDTVDKLD